jgi:diamine N-acetyltransferase
MSRQLLSENIRFTVHALTGDRPTPAGVTTLLLDHSVRTAEFMLLLGPEARGRGLGTDTTRLTLDHAFHVTNLRMVWLRVYAPNTGAIRTYEKAGFAHVGPIRQAGYWRGEVCDELVMDTLASDFTGPSAVMPVAAPAS